MKPTQNHNEPYRRKSEMLDYFDILTLKESCLVGLKAGEEFMEKFMTDKKTYKDFKELTADIDMWINYIKQTASVHLDQSCIYRERSIRLQPTLESIFKELTENWKARITSKYGKKIPIEFIPDFAIIPTNIQS